MATLNEFREWLSLATGFASTLIDTIALIIVVLATIEAALAGLRVTFADGNEHRKREIWLRYARWLVAALTFQLAADIIETSIAPAWDDVARLAVIATVRTMLNYFLEKDMGEIRERQEEQAPSK